MVRNLRNLFLRADLTEQEVRTLHGVVRSLSGRSWEEARQAGEGEPGGS
jgi:tRNA/rRNA methyltransferase